MLSLFFKDKQMKKATTRTKKIAAFMNEEEIKQANAAEVPQGFSKKIINKNSIVVEDKEKEFVERVQKEGIKKFKVDTKDGRRLRAIFKNPPDAIAAGLEEAKKEAKKTSPKTLMQQT